MLKDGWHNAHRLAHLAGGMRADNPPGDVVTFDPRASQTPKLFRLSTYESFHRNLVDVGFQLIGVEYVTHQLQVDGQIPTEWRPHYAGKGGDLGHRAQTSWSQLATGGHDADDYRFIDLCRRVEFQIEAASWRLYDLSNAYYRELWPALKGGNFKHGGKNVTVNSFFIYLALHSVLAELATLRDYLAEFLAKYVWAEFVPKGMHVRRMATLRKHVLKAAADKHDLARFLKDATDESGWLNVLSAYRDLAVHYTPLATAEHFGFVEQALLRISNGTEYPTVRFAMPEDPFAIKRVRSEGRHFHSHKEWMRACWGAEANGPDALLYCHGALGEMCLLALYVADFSPIKGKVFKIGPHNTIGPIRYSNS